MKKYERITEKEKFENLILKNAPYYKVIYEALQELENDLESGKMIRLPCKVGDKLYSIPFDNSEIFEHKVKDFRIIAISENEQSNYIETDIGFLFGENAFLTKAEAEAKLKELKEMQGKWIYQKKLRKLKKA